MDKFWENYIKTRPADSKGAFDAFKKMNQEPRTMVAELTNMNTPDLEQSPDSFLRPGETLEDWDVTFRRPNADGGRAGYNDGQLVTPSVDGSRPGYAGRYEDTEYGSRVKYDTKLKKYVKRVARTVDGKKNYNVYIEQKPNENMKQFLERVAEKGKSQISRAKIARDKINLEQRMYTNNWTKNWLDQNLEKYGVRKFDKMLKDMSNAWQKHVPKIKIPGSDTSAWTTKVLKLPNITTSRGLESAVTKRPFTYEGFTFYTNLESSDDLISKSKSQWRKAFFKNKIRTIPNLEKKIKAYFDFINTPGVGTKKTMAFKEFADKDVLYILSNEDSGLVKASRYELFNSFKSLAKPYNDFTSKINRSETWKKNANLIEEKLGLKKNSIKNSLTAEGKKIKKLFDLKGLPDGLGYSIEHGQGISAAAKTGNVEIMKRAVNDLIGTTRRHNTQLGFHGFEANRNALIREITEGRNVKENIKSLNTLAKDVYKDFGLKGNMYSIKNGVLTSKPISTALTETDRFRQYAIQLAKDPEGLAFIKKRHGSLENMLSLLCTKKASGGRIGYQSGTVVGGTLRCGVKQFNKNLKTGNTNSALMKRILARGGNILKEGAKQLNPAELLRLRNLIGPTALGFMAAFEAGAITDDHLRKGTPWNEAFAKNWLTKSFLPYSEEFARQKNLLQSGQLDTDAQKIYALDMMKYEKLWKEMDRIEGMKSDQLLEQGGYGMIDGSQIVTDEAIADAEANVNRILEDLDSRDSFRNTGKQMENIRAMDEMEAIRMAKPKTFNIGDMEIQYSDGYSPIFGKLGTRLVNKLAAPPRKRTGPMTAKREMKIDYSLPTYDKAITTPLDADQLQAYAEYHRDIGDLEPREELPQWYIDELQQREKWRQLFEKNPSGLLGTQYNADGGRAGYMGGGMTGIRRPSAIPPESGPQSQGLASLKKYGSYY